VGKHRGWIDHVVERVLIEVVSAYRVKGNNAKPFWNGPAYQIDRHDLSVRLACRPRDISRALGFLEKSGFMVLYHKPRFVRGEPRGTMVFAIPKIEAIDQALIEAKELAEARLADADDPESGELPANNSDRAKAPNLGAQPVEHGRSVTPKSGAQPVEHRPHSLNVPNTAANNAVGHAARQVPQTLKPPLHLPGSVPEGGGAAAFEGSTSPPDPLPGAGPAGQSASGPASNPPAPDPAYIEMKVNRFCYYWTEAGRRTEQVEVLAIKRREREALAAFFRENPKSSGWVAAVAIRAWQADDEIKKKGDFDPAWACRKSKYIPTFLSKLSRILSELGSTGYTVNAYRNLRGWFTDSELQKQGFKVGAGLGVLEPDDCWENCAEAPGYYTENGIEMPPEVRVASSGGENR
jgi:hypothetical protein